MTRQTLQLRTLDLFPLRKVLLAAGRGVPSRVPSWNADEQLAVELIEKMKSMPALANPFAGLAVESPRPRSRAAIPEMAGSHA
ncbi:MAG TPA: hypothetical protein PKK96_12125 [Anaerolineales bacterium]|nr:hypothetical protein [Anaerolineales bacterium]HMR99558.1 hypothetical protein [Anaerolineales bacterium]HNQ94723.1 hypothetical protein [Anaerolineales bacterium]HNS61746.1 hypothetical protein [Anaerolineales bacterium]